MKYTYIGKNVVITEGMKAAVENKLSRLEDYFDCEKEVKVVMTTQKQSHKIEVTVYAKDLIIRAEEITEDMYSAIDLIVDKLERQIVKQKSRIQRKYNKSIRDFAHNDYEDYDEEDEKEIVRRKSVDSKPMTDNEAILQMELLNHNFYVYKNTRGALTVVYKRKDGNYGLIEPY